MDFLTAFDISASGLAADRTRINTISMNLANAKTTRTPQGGPYRRRSVLQQTADVDDPFSIHMRSALDREVKGVRVMAVTVDNRPLKRVYEPGHPDADAQGYVSYPDINVVEEMANLMTAQRNYEANVTTAEALKGMYVKALEIGK
ncbi:flagellar basal body rod protein FlgC [Desulfovibrio legallii]|jgi:flagellar basal-body rod protein FlgC|uniref:Flagellar basal-body rod protein FlgC n=1 Tax=Desulfovibrio legallii TaxID=571438 RepID=A0A6H3FBD2_9BACT|nr:flagellar basal body rod protein FlgC [Desulfovibrio legallii]RHH26079.1 flagellar basal body rod protein FlgC [Desulfovibrio sp. AM18-2]TBH79656.1 flagellar basal body rod protein FlgC [Desulfovibrio legallii]CAI3223254.1 Flagellar basal-body rod protein FlgC [Desulfovibrio diazotrophicus]VVU42787.1 Flagellar basal-body rod protein FlgC [Desulfovibrio diazotrophicus]